LALKEINDKVAKTELLQHRGAHPARLEVYFTEVLLPRAQVKRLSRHRMLHNCLDNTGHVLDNVACWLTQASLVSHV